MRKALSLICTHEYFGQARTTVASFLRHHDGFDVVLFADSDPGIPEVSRLVPLNDRRFCREAPSKFERIEMARPMAHLETLDMGYDAVLYCDSDMYFTGTLDVPARSVFTPHRVNAVGRCDPRVVIESGFINIGMYWLVDGVATRRFLSIMDDLSRRVEAGVNTRPPGRYWQQRLYNYLPYFHGDYELSDDTALNVAYWNVDERGGVVHEDGVYRIGRLPLKCYHFSGWAGPGVMSSFRRAPVAGGLSELYAEYAAELAGNEQQGAMQ